MRARSWKAVTATSLSGWHENEEAKTGKRVSRPERMSAAPDVRVVRFLTPQKPFALSIYSEAISYPRE